MEPIFRTRHRVLAHECDSFGHVNNAAYIRQLEQATLDALGAVNHDSAFLDARRLAIEYHAPVRYGDELRITAWVMDEHGRDATWAYRVISTADDAPAVAAEVTWKSPAPLTAATIPRPSDIAGDGALPAPLKPFITPPDNGANPFRWIHTVRHYELAASGNVTVAVYFNWLEEATIRAADIAGWPLERMNAHNFIAFQYRHDAEFFQPVSYPDEVEIVSRLVDVRRVRGTWIHEVFRAADGVLLMRDYSTGAFLRRGGKMRSVPREMTNALVRGDPA